MRVVLLLIQSGADFRYELNVSLLPTPLKPGILGSEWEKQRGSRALKSGCEMKIGLRLVRSTTGKRQVNKTLPVARGRDASPGNRTLKLDEIVEFQVCGLDN
jgi:hypothetical protein